MDAPVPAVRVDKVTIARGGNVVLNDVSFEVEPNTLLGVIGPSGGGKSTLFETVAGLLPVDQGSVDLLGPAGQPGGVAYVSQRENINWNFPATVMDVVMMGRFQKLGWFRRPGERDRELARISLSRVGLWDFRDSLVTELSGGQRQRVGIARALAQEASVILLDEAFSGVDVGAQEGIVEILQACVAADRIVFLSTHDLSNVSERFDKILCINRRVCGYGSPDEVFIPDVLEELYGSHIRQLSFEHRG